MESNVPCGEEATWGRSGLEVTEKETVATFFASSRSLFYRQESRVSGNTGPGTTTNWKTIWSCWSLTVSLSRNLGFFVVAFISGKLSSRSRMKASYITGKNNQSPVVLCLSRKGDTLYSSSLFCCNKIQSSSAHGSACRFKSGPHRGGRLERIEK